VRAQTDDGVQTVAYCRLVVALGAVSRVLPIPGLAEHGLGFKDLADAIYLRNHVLRRLEVAATATAEAHRRRELTFIFVGAGYAGVEALGELAELVRDAMRYYPELHGAPQRWVLVDAAPRILPEIPTRLGEYAAAQLARRGVELRVRTTLDRLEPHAATLSDGERILTSTLVWTAGVRASPMLAELGLPLDEQRRVQVDGTLRVQGHENVWALGDSARVPNAATPELPDPPTSQHALRQARRLAKNLRWRATPVPLSLRRPGCDAQPLQGHRRARPHPDSRVPRLVRHSDVSPLPAPAPLAEAAGHHRLDGRALLPSRHRGARHARPPSGPTR
jgi:NADH:ubiquinone reductase (H+-translocating)